MSTSDYEEALSWLFPLRRSGAERGLEPIRQLLELLGNPQDDFRSIHVTGTSGKGSTSAMIASILRAGGFRVGLFTSPHLESFTERIVVDGRQIPEEDVVRLLKGVRPLLEEMGGYQGPVHATFFEVTTAIALEYFAEEGVDLAVLEAGMGGRLDATNVVGSLVSVITNVSLEHTGALGDTVLKIAEEKAGIVKPGGVLVTATQDDDVYALFVEACERVGSRIFRVGRDIAYEKLGSSLKGQRFRLRGLRNNFEELYIPLLGEHQIVNAATAVGAVEALGFHGVDVPREAIMEGLRRVRWPGRLEVIRRRPLVVLDAAKDLEAARALKEALLEDFSYRRLLAVVSISSDKDIPGMVGQFAEAADHFIITAHGVMGRAADPSIIADEVRKRSKTYSIAPYPKDALEEALAMADEDDMVIVTGSVFLVGEARSLLGL